MTAPAVSVTQIHSRAEKDAFIKLPWRIYESDPAWVPPLDMMIRDRLDPKKDPIHRHADVVLFTAWKGGRLVGRTSATIDRAWLDTWKDDTGHFGYFDFGLTQRLLGLDRGLRVVIGADVPHDPLVEPALTIGTRHKAADLIAHHRLEVMSETGNCKHVGQLRGQARISIGVVLVVQSRLLARLHAEKRGVTVIEPSRT